MTSIERRIENLEGRASGVLRDAQEEERDKREWAITVMILDEFARLKRDGEQVSLDKAVRNVVEDQYQDLDLESRRYIADGWSETIHSWTRLDWMVRAGREGPPRA
jgi:N-acyl-D-aspartate/D-glutamate deacylase